MLWCKKEDKTYHGKQMNLCVTIMLCFKSKSEYTNKSHCEKN
jgi:hypothetical protein